MNAWTVENAKERHKAINETWVKFRQSSRLAKIEWQKSKVAAWVQFEKDRTSCKAPVTGENQSLEEVEVTE